MMRKNVGLMMAVAASMASMSPQVQVQSAQVQVRSPGGASPGAMSAPQGGIASLLNAVIMGGGGSGGKIRPPRHNRHRGYTCAEGKRRARKARNKLRHKGQHRKAVR